MKAVIVLAIVLVVAAVVINAEEKHKDKKEREHDQKDHKEHAERHGKNKNKENHDGKKDRHTEEHDGKKDRHSDKNKGKKERHSEKHDGKDHKERSSHIDGPKHSLRLAAGHEKLDRLVNGTCAENEKGYCSSTARCVIFCQDKDNIIRYLECRILNARAEFLVNLGLSNDSTDRPEDEDNVELIEGEEELKTVESKECPPDHEHFECVCKDGFYRNEDEDNCVAKNDCPK